MSTKIFNQKGFTAFEGILIAIILALIAGVGYYVYQARTDQVSDNKTEVVKKKDPYQGWNTFESGVVQGLSFKYPSTWRVETIEKNNEYKMDEVSIKSTDGLIFTFSTPISGFGGACYDPDTDPNNENGLGECPLDTYEKIGSTKIKGIDVYKRTLTSKERTSTSIVLVESKKLGTLNNKRTIGVPGNIQDEVCKGGCIFNISFPEKYSKDYLSTLSGKEAKLILESVNKE